MKLPAVSHSFTFEEDLSCKYGGEEGRFFPFIVVLELNHRSAEVQVAATTVLCRKVQVASS